MEHAADPDLVRDARRGDEAAFTSLHPGLHSKNLLTILNGREIEPVSYTHLTLPTILLV